MTDVTHPPVVYVEWIDAAQLSGAWQDREEMAADAARFSGPISAAGFLLGDLPDWVIISAAYNRHADAAAQGCMIPRVAITKMVVLRPARGMEVGDAGG